MRHHARPARRLLGTPPLRSYDDITALGKEVVARGFTALKTNIVIPGEPATVYFPGFASGINTTDGAPTVESRGRRKLIGTFRDAVGPGVGICLDLNYNFRTEGVLRIAKLLEPFDMQWVEYDNWDPEALLQIKDSTSTPIASCESLVTTKQYRPFLELHAMDVCIIDVPWNGFRRQQIGDGRGVRDQHRAAQLLQPPGGPALDHFCAALPNVQIMEIDIDDVPWKAELVTLPPEDQGRAYPSPEGPGLGHRHQRGGAARAPVAGARGGEARGILRNVTRADGRAAEILSRESSSLPPS